jgi:hypothetical protein
VLAAKTPVPTANNSVTLSVLPSRRFPKPWTVEPIPADTRIIDPNSIVLAHVYGQPDGAIAVSEGRLIVEPKKEPDKARSRRKPQALRFKPVTIGDLIREGKLLETMPGSA